MDGCSNALAWNEVSYTVSYLVKCLPSLLLFVCYFITCTMTLYITIYIHTYIHKEKTGDRTTKMVNLRHRVTAVTLGTKGQAWFKVAWLEYGWSWLWVRYMIVIVYWCSPFVKLDYPPRPMNFIFPRPRILITNTWHQLFCCSASMLILFLFFWGFHFGVVAIFSLFGGFSWWWMKNDGYYLVT